MSGRWIFRPEIVSYIIDSYAGTEAKEGISVKRRVFIWEESKDIKMGNCEAFVAHLARRYDLLNPNPSDVHALLRDLGERVLPETPGKQRRGKPGRFKQPDPDEWTIGKATDTKPKP